MEIRKTFKFEAAHIVRGAWSKRCSHNTHGHSYIVEVFFGLKKGHQLNLSAQGNGGMVVDFGIIKKYGNDFIDSFDHSLFLWAVPKDQEFIKFAQTHFERVIITPFPTSAEVQAMMFMKFFTNLVAVLWAKRMIDEGVCVSRVIVHETATGKAECKSDDITHQINLCNHTAKPNFVVPLTSRKKSIHSNFSEEFTCGLIIVN